MTMPFYASAEQVMRDRSELARKGIARGRSVVVLTYADGVVFVAENPSTALHKVGEIYDRIGFAAVGRYNEFDTLRTGGIRFADLRGYSYDRRDVSGRALANFYSAILGEIFTNQQKPFEVEVCVAEVGETPADDQLYRLTYDGSVNDFPDFVVMGGQAEAISTLLRESYQPRAALADAVGVAVRALAAVGGDGGKPREIPSTQLEIAVLDRQRPTRKFKRMLGAALTPLLPVAEPEPEPPAADGDQPNGETAGGDQPAAEEPAAEEPAGEQAPGETSETAETAETGETTETGEGDPPNG
jgi:proteasome alpha subunit